MDTKARAFSVLSHLASMLFAQLSHAISLNDVCDWLRLKAAALSRLQIVPPSRNTLSHLAAALASWDGRSHRPKHRFHSVKLMGQHPPEKENPDRESCNSLCSSLAAVSL